MIITYNLSELRQTAEQILDYCTSKTLLFEGEMGSGKTTLIKEIINCLGISDTTSSPTYGFVNVYESANGTVVNHFDLYRLNVIDEAYDIGLEEYFYNDNYNLIEWPEVALDIIPDNGYTIIIEKISENIRKLIIEKK
ncbi:tRNA (adenosine(37)-N6)-threonylcarbamoyltransferase complex ATPase subunit type 1 TsaE [Neptunitalea chrysea]|uniref:tRNA threonylcarbamoyladenosine biosynthesis protein TsaE n=1 Tax=Neptunitalea chrysea TaxID=1647581 RepID=A0A9W6EU09_9FLAO|nr:tRNA (adenosine(37)-N6)-threonylcarbamoyltransferase complex ATPase subunit type 1 TsaE [Neptunitalea chrysea]GLB51979.1 tRNA (adenosine(37)-N6)-threonylcarbamoyltransferase complex ATPase subunit type 1 TsaE [Neptunitalea chrysea]